MSKSDDHAKCAHDWKIWPETDGQEQRCMRCGEYRRTPAAHAQGTTPVAWRIPTTGGSWYVHVGPHKPRNDAEPLYARSPTGMATNDLSCAADFLDEIEVDENGKCDWTAVANAQTNIRAALRCWSHQEIADLRAQVEEAAKQLKQIEDDCREAADLRSRMTHDASQSDLAEAYRRIAFTLEVIGRSISSTEHHT